MATQEPTADVEQEIKDTFGMVPPPLSDIPKDDMVGEWHFFQKYTVGESEIPPKYRELMGLAVAANIKCPYCTHFHRNAAQMHGATEAELDEAASLASHTSRYSAMLHALEYDLEEFKVKMAQIADHLESQAADD
ncbi:carboxymuconolactone decarboxylase family protein [Haloarcula marina]|uniref:carboxymuconolactone decarboxylase family protein n=1 Tax=Haloarcula marina TaxID=2961574 RepID=UPI0020B69860|nr:carboxymuconolactone decarboxylase family protein [Halomicroarcula marina]